MEKQQKQELFDDYKIETLNKNEKVILDAWNKFSSCTGDCDLLSDPIKIVFCESGEQKRLWTGLVHLVSSLPYRGAVGRQKKMLVTCGDTILGFIHLTSALAQLRVRDRYLEWSHEEKWSERKINGIYNIQTCVPTRKYAPLLTGKLLVYCIFSSEVSDFLEVQYGDSVTGFETTSLYGKSSMYNRIPFFSYLGLTDGLSAVYLTQSEWKQVKKDYYDKYPNTPTNRQAEAKFQIIDKLKTWYQQHEEDFPYEYQSASFKRGVYYGEPHQGSLNDMILQWQSRWLEMRARKYKPYNGVQICKVAHEWLCERGIVGVQQAMQF